MEEPEDLSYRGPVSCELVRVVLVVPDVTDVLVSPSSAVSEFCDGFSCCSDWAFFATAVICFLQKCALLLYSYARRGLKNDK